jgi:hypothetical protein
MISRKSAIMIAAIASVMISVPMILGTVSQGLLQHRCSPFPECLDVAEEMHAAPVALSGSNIYTAWNNASATLHGDAIFFTKSNDGGKTFSNAMVLSPPNTNPKISVMRTNVSIGASGNTVTVTWWTNETGALNPVMRTSGDGGNTFGNLVKLNSASGGIIK